jgi:hypothetical protein
LLISGAADLFLAAKLLKAVGPAARFLGRTLNLPFKGGTVLRGGELHYVADRVGDVRDVTAQAADAGRDVLGDIYSYTALDAAGEVAGAGGSFLEGQRGIAPFIKDAALGLVPFYGSYLAYKDFRSACADDEDFCPAGGN